MCFSPSASFIAAGVTGAIGFVALTRANQPGELSLAVVPIFFALQQGMEGSLWLSLPSAPEGALAIDLTFCFLLFAEVFWPVYAPLTIWLVEPHSSRRDLMLFCLAVGLPVSGYLLWWLLTRSHGAAIRDGHLVYGTEGRHAPMVGIGYVVATSLPLLLSSQRTLSTLGVSVLVGSVTAGAFHWEAFVSVWCFFAAAASVVIVCHFEFLRRQTLNSASSTRSGATFQR